MVRIVKKPTERKSDIIRTALLLFKSRGYEQTTMQEVMDQLGIAKGTIYHYFKSKEELLEAVVENLVAGNIEELQNLLDKTDGDALQKIRCLIEAGNLAASHDELLEHLHQPGNTGMHIRMLAAALTQQAPIYAELIGQGCREGLFQTEHPLECAEFILSAIQFLTDAGLYPWSQPDLMRRALAFPDLIEAQLKAPRGSFQFMLERLQTPADRQ